MPQRPLRFRFRLLMLVSATVAAGILFWWTSRSKQLREQEKVCRTVIDISSGHGIDIRPKKYLKYHRDGNMVRFVLELEAVSMPPPSGPGTIPVPLPESDPFFAGIAAGNGKIVRLTAGAMTLLLVSGTPGPPLLLGYGDFGKSPQNKNNISGVNVRLR